MPHVLVAFKLGALENLLSENLNTHVIHAGNIHAFLGTFLVVCDSPIGGPRARDPVKSYAANVNSSFCPMKAVSQP